MSSGHGKHDKLEDLHARLAAIEGRFQVALTGEDSTPFIVDTYLPPEDVDTVTRAVQAIPLRVMLQRYPALAVWAVLHPLSAHYGGDRDVYLHISRFAKERLDDPASRDNLKFWFRAAARRIGLPVSGNEPTGLFFAPLGPARSQHPDLAGAFVGAAISMGPPAIEDTASARNWQRRAVRERCPTLTRLRAAIHFDASAHCARRFAAWRSGAEPVSDSEGHLFAAYEAAARSFGRTRKDLVGAPRIFWSGDLLGLEAEASRDLQRITLGPFPTQLAGGQRMRIPGPWPAKIRWSAGPTQQDVPFAPADGEALVFDADSGALLGRVGPAQEDLEVAAEHLVVLSRDPFSSPSFGEAFPAADPDVHVAWVTSGETLSFEYRPLLRLVAPKESAIWIEGVVIGRDGARALYTCDGALHLTMDPEVGGAERIVRARIGADVRFVGISLDEDGRARLPFSEFRFDQPASPSEVVFEVLAPGAAGDMAARAELSVAAWVWPGLSAPEEDLEDAPVPGNFDRARSAGLREENGRIFVDPRAEVETPILGLAGKSRTHEFRLVARSEKLWHVRVLGGDLAYLPRGTTLVLGHDNRHDTLRLRSPDRNADLLVLGRLKRRPFLARQEIEIGASELESAQDGDDRIALRRADGHIDLLARLRRVDDPSEIKLEDRGAELRFSMTARTPHDAMRIRLETAVGKVVEGDYAFGRRPTELAPIAAIVATRDANSGRLDFWIDRSALAAPARIIFALRTPDGTLDSLRDARGHRIALGLPGDLAHPESKVLGRLATFLAEPEPEALSSHLRDALMPAYVQAFEALGAAGMVTPLKPALAVTRENGQPPRHDLVGVAPWIFEAPPTAFGGLPVDSGLSALSQFPATAHVDPPPSLEGDTPLSDWLTRVSGEVGLPDAFRVEALQHAFRALRSRLRDTDLGDLVRDGQVSSVARLICDVHIEGLDLLRSFDDSGGGDPVPARMAAQIERFARAAAMHRADQSIDDIVFRTGLPRADIGQALTMMLRGCIEFFVYFRALWACATREASGT